MEINIKATPKELADIVLELQGQQSKNKQSTEITGKTADVTKSMNKFYYDTFFYNPHLDFGGGNGGKNC
ncbi:hypothetical protein LJB89_03875 [Tyzzerella sp. OttesenSCG-928-J15]|nr:hypothetical protein [Tyzzerella sp. OttesenSCG-928-J15]